MFHGVRGQHIKDGQSPSLYNTEEIEVVKSYVNKLLESNQVSDRGRNIFLYTLSPK